MRSAPRVDPGVVVLDHVNPTRTWLCAERESSYDVWEQIAGLPGDYPSVLFLCEHCRRPITRVVAYARHSSGPVEAVGYNGAVTTVHQTAYAHLFPADPSHVGQRWQERHPMHGGQRAALVCRTYRCRGRPTPVVLTARMLAGLFLVGAQGDGSVVAPSATSV